VLPVSLVDAVVEPSVELFLAPLPFYELPILSLELSVSLPSAAYMLEPTKTKLGT
jgi:hypothetical protein